MAARMRTLDWAPTPLGPPAGWSPALCAITRFLLLNKFPIMMWWGPRFVQLYNDPYLPVLGAKHPGALGQPGEDCWPEIWPIMGSLIRPVLAGGEAAWQEDLPLWINRRGFREEAYFTFACSPVPDPRASGGVGGVLATVHETTVKIIGERRMQVLRDLGTGAMEAKSVPAAATSLNEVLARDTLDLPQARVLLGHDQAAWRDAQVEIERGGSRSWLSPLRGDTADQPRAALLTALSPNLADDGEYRRFLELVSSQVAAALAHADAYAASERRALALAEVDRTKTAFFTNISREFRTPLTLLLGPLAEIREALSRPPGESWTSHLREQAAIADRNAQRLLRPVNALLAFSRVEAGRARVRYQPTDLAQLTADLASQFRSVCAAAGLQFDVACAAFEEPVFVDREMWEDILLYLLSNAFKFTFEGGIRVKLANHGGCAVLQVEDTGIGIAAEELPHLFDRFHRVEGARGRTYEGAGIGLALVRELAELHGGTVAVASTLGRGSTFTVRVPLGHAHLPAERIEAEKAALPGASRPNLFAREAAGWLRTDATEPAASPTVLYADDNADMQEHVARLLTPRYRVHLASDGIAALAAIERERPDFVLADLMMPGLDGLALARALRARPETAELPLILLSTRADEEARADGLAAGADDYLVKPFSPRELEARIAAQLATVAARAHATAAVNESEARLRALATAGGDEIFRTDADARAWLEQKVAPEQQEMARARVEAALATRTMFEIEHGSPRANGSMAWMITRAVPLLDANGGVREWFAWSRDITARHRLEMRQQVMTAELQHRTRNLLGVVRSIAGQTLETSLSLEHFHERFEGRLRALSRVQALLSGGGEVVTLSALVRLELDALGASHDPRVVVEGPEVPLPSASVQTLALALHELATNARKHGALRAEDGRLAIAWRIAGAQAAERLILEWTETGMPPAGPPPPQPGYGRELIEQSLPYSLNAQTTFELTPHGLHCRIELPLGTAPEVPR